MHNFLGRDTTIYMMGFLDPTTFEKTKRAVKPSDEDKIYMKNVEKDMSIRRKIRYLARHYKLLGQMCEENHELIPLSFLFLEHMGVRIVKEDDIKDKDFVKDFTGDLLLMFKIFMSFLSMTKKTLKWVDVWSFVYDLVYMWRNRNLSPVGQFKCINQDILDKLFIGDTNNENIKKLTYEGLGKVKDANGEPYFPNNITDFYEDFDMDQFIAENKYEKYLF